jgi:hypothetical protein
MVVIPTFFFALGACLSFIPTTLAVGQVQKPDLVVPSKYAAQKDVVADMFRESYTFYTYELLDSACITSSLPNREYAFGQDNVAPLTKGKSPHC